MPFRSTSVHSVHFIQFRSTFVYSDPLWSILVHSVHFGLIGPSIFFLFFFWLGYFFLVFWLKTSLFFLNFWVEKYDILFYLGHQTL